MTQYPPEPGLKLKIVELTGKPIDNLVMRRVIWGIGLTTIDQFLALTYDQLLKLRGVGPTRAKMTVELQKLVARKLGIPFDSVAPITPADTAPLPRLVSERGIELLDQDVNHDTLITVERYDKWYNLYKVEPDRTVSIVSPSVVSQIAAPFGGWIDQSYHPRTLLLVAKKYNAVVSPLTMELVTGRWILSPWLNNGFKYSLEEDEHGN